MAAEYILLGTGTHWGVYTDPDGPESSPTRATAAVLVRDGESQLLFDAGRAAVLRLGQVGIAPSDLTAVFVSHRHSDHIHSIHDVAMTCWFDSRLRGEAHPLVIYAPRGDAARVIRRLIDAFEEEIGEAAPGRRPSDVVADIREFEHGDAPVVVFEGGRVRVSAVSVPHGPTSVAFRVDTSSGAIVYSGDTPVCEAVERLATEAKVLIHEVIRAGVLNAPPFEKMRRVHADSSDLGAMAQRARVSTLVLTHFLPPPTTERHLAGFVKDVREGGYTGEIVVGADLLRRTIE